MSKDLSTDCVVYMLGFIACHGYDCTKLLEQIQEIRPAPLFHKKPAFDANH